MARRIRDKRTLELFDPQIEAPTPREGMVDLDVELRDALNEAISKAPITRAEIAAKMSDLTGRDITQAMLNAYTGESRQDHNFPFRYAAAFEVVTESFALTHLLARARGGRVLLGEQALLAEVARIDQALSDLKKHRANVLQKISQ